MERRLDAQQLDWLDRVTEDLRHEEDDYFSKMGQILFLLLTAVAAIRFAMLDHANDYNRKVFGGGATFAIDAYWVVVGLVPLIAATALAHGKARPRFWRFIAGEWRLGLFTLVVGLALAGLALYDQAPTAVAVLMFLWVVGADLLVVAAVRTKWVWIPAVLARLFMALLTLGLGFDLHDLGVAARETPSQSSGYGFVVFWPLFGVVLLVHLMVLVLNLTRRNEAGALRALCHDLVADRLPAEEVEMRYLAIRQRQVAAAPAYPAQPASTPIPPTGAGD